MQHSLFLVICVASIVLGCRGKAQVERQQQEEISFEKNRSLENEGRFGLLASPGTDSFEGTTILYQSAPPAEALAELLIASRDFRLARGEYYAFLTKIKPEKSQNILVKADQLSEMERKLTQVQREEQSAAYFGDKATSSYEARWRASLDFTQTMLDRQIKAGSDISGFYGAYCDAKLLEFAVSAMLYNQKFLKRPSPHILCEAYYTGSFPGFHEAPYFQGDICSEAYISENGAAACIWNEGVYKTLWFSSLPKKFPESSPAYCSPQHKTVAACFEAKYRSGSFDLLKAFARTDLPLNVRKSLLNFASSAREEVLAGYTVPQIYFQFIDVTKLPKPYFFNKKPAQLVSQMQRKLGENEGGPLPDTALDLQRALAYLGERLEAEGEDGGDFAASESDFHFFVTADALLREVKHDEFFVNASLEQAGKNLGALLMPRDSQKSEALRSEMAQAQEALAADKQNLQKLEQELDKNLRRNVQSAVKVAHADGLASAFWSTYRVVVSRKDSALRIELLLRQPEKDESLTIVEKCIDLVSTSSFSCGELFPDSTLIGQRVEAEGLSYDPKTGLLTLSHQVSEPLALGWQFNPRSASKDKSYFQDLPLVTFAHTDWEWKIFPGQLEGGMNILTGDLTISRAHAPVAAGNFSWYQRTAE